MRVKNIITVVMMRQSLVLSILFSCFSSGIMAQEGSHAFLKEGKTWNCMLVKSGPDSYTEHYQNIIRGDSIVNGISYFKMYREADTTSELDFFALWREEGGKVFAYVPGEGKERLMYDFSAQPGSVVACEGETTQVKACTEVNVGNQSFNCLSVLVYDDYLVPWVEGVGSPYGPGYPLGPMLTDGKRTELLSCYENDKLVFESADFGRIVYASINATTTSPDHTSPVYDLNGVRIKQPQKGVYIRNGKKIIKK